MTMLCLGIQAQRVNLNDWTMLTDGSQYEWVTDKYQWGNTYYDADGNISVKTDRRQDGDDIVETYTFTNISKKKMTVRNIGIYVPFNDNRFFRVDMKQPFTLSDFTLDNIKAEDKHNCYEIKKIQNMKVSNVTLNKKQMK
jgi:hypothetical protein